MTFPDAVKICLNKYVGFSGRARRSEYWWFVLFTVLVSIVASIIDAIIGTSSGGTGLISGLASLALFLPSLAVAIRRLHDTSRSGWWVLIGLIPIIGWIVLIIFYVQDSHPDNKYGPSPKYAGAPGAGGTDGPYGAPPANPYGEAPGGNQPPDPYADPPA